MQISKRIKILNCEIDDISLAEAVSRALELSRERNGAYVVTPNTQIVLDAGKNERLREAINASDISLPDGAGVVIASRIIGTPVRARIAGIDFAAKLLAALSSRGGSVFLFGGRNGTAELAAKKLACFYPGLVVSGCCGGFFDEDEERVLISAINAVSPDFLLVCLGSPKQELWMRAHAGKLEVGLMAGLGGTIDVFAGKVRRAPMIWQMLGLEWLYRTAKEPRRIVKAVKLPQIIPASVRQRIGRKRTK